MNVNPGLGTDFRSLADGTALRRFEDSSGVRGEKCGANPWADPWSAAGHRRGAGSSPTWGANPVRCFPASLLSYLEVTGSSAGRHPDQIRTGLSRMVDVLQRALARSELRMPPGLAVSEH
jgi:hypothetical protein